MSLDGKKFFYVNPLESRGNHHRMPWFGCACCPPNVARTLASLGGYAYAVGQGSIWVNLYIQGSATTTLDGKKVTLDVTTDYPWDGKVTIKPQVEAPATFALRLRMPGWCRSPMWSINGDKPSLPGIGRVPLPYGAGEKSCMLSFEHGYLTISRAWKTGDVVELNLLMPVEQVLAHPNVKADAGLAALQRGPLIYCLEQTDLPPTSPAMMGVSLDSLFIPLGAEFHAERAPNLLGGVTVLKGSGQEASLLNWGNALYQPAPPVRSVGITAIPYYAWDNRKPGAMRVWHPITPPVSAAGGPETRARVTLSFTSGNCQPSGINDGKEPKRSSEHPGALCHWWPHHGGQEWAQYTWKSPVTLTGARVYWFDDTNVGACRLPASWQVEYKDGDAWKPVKATSDYPVALDRWCRVTFEPLTTTALRLAVKLQPEWAAGVHEWKVDEREDD